MLTAAVLGRTLPAAPSSVDAAAAVCVRRRGTRVEVLLVRTGGGRRWSFPKGRVEACDVDTSAAAARELLEEAGIAGVPVDRSVATLRHRKRDGSVQVAAVHLVIRPVPGGRAERRRDPTWCSVAAAERRLAKGRGVEQAAEFVRVLRLAVAWWLAAEADGAASPGLGRRHHSDPHG